MCDPETLKEKITNLTGYKKNTIINQHRCELHKMIQQEFVPPPQQPLFLSKHKNNHIPTQGASQTCPSYVYVLLQHFNNIFKIK